MKAISRNDILKKYFNRILCVLVILMGSFTSCEDDSDMDLSLAVNSNSVKLPATGGQTHIMVYSTGEWNAEFTAPVNWASINKLIEKGNSSVLLSYAQNFGAPRKLVINLTKTDESEEIKVVQEGITPELKFPTTKYTLPKTELPTSIPLTTNLKHDLADIQVSILYDDETSEEWISEFKVTEKAFEFNALENNLGEYRSARVTLKFIDGFDKAYTTYVDIGQTLDLATVSQERNVTDLTKFEASSSVVLSGNMTPSLVFFDQKVEYLNGADWISNIEVTNSKLTFDIAANESGGDRSAKIILSLTTSKGQTFKIEHTVNQYATSYTTYSFDDLRALIPGATGEVLISDAMAGLTGIIISDAGNPNMETNLNTAFNKIDFTENEKTAYLQSLDGKYGIRIKLSTADDNTFKRYSKTTIGLSGLTLVKESNPERYTLKGVTTGSILESVPGSSGDLVKKEKFIADLTDDDVYTYVTLKDVEFSIPYGSYLNTNTGYVANTTWNTGGVSAGGAYLDAVPSTLIDNKGSNINFVINAKVSWYKNTLPKGSGTISGIIVNTKLIRFGNNDGDIGRYQIRVLDEQGLSLSGTAKNTTLAEWNWIKNGNDISAAGTIQKDGDGFVMPAIGTGKLHCTASTSTGLGSQPIYFPNAASKGGINSAMHYTAKWWNASTNKGEAFVFNFSTSGITGSNLTVNLTQGAGSGTAATMAFPAYWQIEYSTDGVNYTVLPSSTYCVRPLGWWGGTLQFVNLGLVNRSFVLPSSLFGKDNVYVKLAAKSNVCATSTGAENGTLDANSPAVNVRLGFVSFKYNK